MNRWGGVASGCGRKPGFWSRVAKSRSCWLWTGYLTADGSGKFCTTGRTVVAHRYAWELTNGPIPAGMYLVATCGIARCVRPDHRRLMTAGEVGRTFAGRAEQTDKHGELGTNVKLTEDEVREILEVYRTSRRYGVLRRLAREFDVAHATICGIVYGKTWTHLRGAPARAGGDSGPLIRASQIEERDDLDLDSRDRAVARARESGDLNNQEIADTLGLTLNQVLAAIVRARRAAVKPRSLVEAALAHGYGRPTARPARSKALAHPNCRPGQGFGRWTVKVLLADGRARCQCACGRFGKVTVSVLLDGGSRQCGTCAGQPAKEDPNGV